MLDVVGFIPFQIVTQRPSMLVLDRHGHGAFHMLSSMHGWNAGYVDLYQHAPTFKLHLPNVQRLRHVRDRPGSGVDGALTSSDMDL